jgi:acetolactate decarboxylase
MKILKYLIILLTVITFASCGSADEKASVCKVEYKGALKNMMHKGDISAKADLADYENREHFYAIGAFEDLKGEIQIFDSESFNTVVIDNVLTFDKSFDKKATLLVYASVSKWKSIIIPDNVVTYEQFESFIDKAAEENQLNMAEPFPFLLEGTPKSFDWHVINWKDGDMEHSHDKHVSSGLHGTIKERQLEMLGFYSTFHHTIFTHHTTNMHIHVKTHDNKMAGHVDALTLGKGMILKLPDIR